MTFDDVRVFVQVGDELEEGRILVDGIAGALGVGLELP